MQIGTISITGDMRLVKGGCLCLSPFRINSYIGHNAFGHVLSLLAEKIIRKYAILDGYDFEPAVLVFLQNLFEGAEQDKELSFRIEQTLNLLLLWNGRHEAKNQIVCHQNVYINNLRREIELNLSYIRQISFSHYQQLQKLYGDEKVEQNLILRQTLLSGLESARFISGPPPVVLQKQSIRDTEAATDLLTIKPHSLARPMQNVFKAVLSINHTPGNREIFYSSVKNQFIHRSITSKTENMPVFIRGASSRNLKNSLFYITEITEDALLQVHKATDPQYMNNTHLLERVDIAEPVYKKLFHTHAKTDIIGLPGPYPGEAVRYPAVTGEIKDTYQILSAVRNFLTTPRDREQSQLQPLVLSFSTLKDAAAKELLRFRKQFFTAKFHSLAQPLQNILKSVFNISHTPGNRELFYSRAYNQLMRHFITNKAGDVWSLENMPAVIAMSKKQREQAGDTQRFRNMPVDIIEDYIKNIVKRSLHVSGDVPFDLPEGLDRQYDDKTRLLQQTDVARFIYKELLHSRETADIGAAQGFYPAELLHPSAIFQIPAVDQDLLISPQNLGESQLLPAVLSFSSQKDAAAKGLLRFREQLFTAKFHSLAPPLQNILKSVFNISHTPGNRELFYSLAYNQLIDHFITNKVGDVWDLENMPLVATVLKKQKEQAGDTQRFRNMPVDIIEDYIKNIVKRSVHVSGDVPFDLPEGLDRQYDDKTRLLQQTDVARFIYKELLHSRETADIGAAQGFYPAELLHPSAIFQIPAVDQDLLISPQNWGESQLLPAVLSFSRQKEAAAKGLLRFREQLFTAKFHSLAPSFQNILKSVFNISHTPGNRELFYSLAYNQLIDHFITNKVGDVLNVENMPVYIIEDYSKDLVKKQADATGVSPLDLHKGIVSQYGDKIRLVEQTNMAGSIYKQLFHTVATTDITGPQGLSPGELVHHWAFYQMLEAGQNLLTGPRNRGQSQPLPTVLPYLSPKDLTAMAKALDYTVRNFIPSQSNSTFIEKVSILADEPKSARPALPSEKQVLNLNLLTIKPHIKPFSLPKRAGDMFYTADGKTIFRSLAGERGVADKAPYTPAIISDSGDVLRTLLTSGGPPASPPSLGKLSPKISKLRAAAVAVPGPNEFGTMLPGGASRPKISFLNIRRLPPAESAPFSQSVATKGELLRIDRKNLIKSLPTVKSGHLARAFSRLKPIPVTDDRYRAKNRLIIPLARELTLITRDRMVSTAASTANIATSAGDLRAPLGDQYNPTAINYKTNMENNAITMIHTAAAHKGEPQGTAAPVLSQRELVKRFGNLIVESNLPPSELIDRRVDTVLKDAPRGVSAKSGMASLEKKIARGEELLKREQNKVIEINRKVKEQEAIISELNNAYNQLQEDLMARADEKQMTAKVMKELRAKLRLDKMRYGLQ